MTTIERPADSLPTPRSTDMPLTGADHAAPVRDLLEILIDLKSWLRQARQAQPKDSPAAALPILATLERCGPARVSEVADAAHLHCSVVSRQISALERAGLATRHTDPTDGRAYEVELSPAGRETLGQMRDQVVESVSRRLSGWRDDELSDLTAHLRRLVDDLTERPTPPATPPSIDGPDRTTP